MARKILLADDSVTAQNMGRRILTDAGYEVITVNNGSAAMKKVNEIRPDLIVLDIYMPGYSGLEICQRIRETPELARIPVLLTVGKLEPFKADDAKRVRADAFVIKPFDASELLTALTKLEDKIVPAGQSFSGGSFSGGRFARAVASIEEAKAGKEFGDTDTGWKSRLKIPAPYSKPHESHVESQAAPPVAIPESGIKAPEPKVPEPKVEEKAAEKQTGNVTSILPEAVASALPHNVTPEEIEAIAAAAALLASHADMSADAPLGSHRQADVQEETSGGSTAANSADEASSASMASGTQAQAEVASPGLPEIAEVKPSNEVRNSSEAIDAQAEPARQTSPGAREDEVTAMLASLSPSSSPSSGSAEKSQTSEVEETVPVTMAAAGAEAYSGRRWIAEETAVSAEESGLILQHEMEQAFAAFAAADAARMFHVEYLRESGAKAVAENPPKEVEVAETESRPVAADDLPAEQPGPGHEAQIAQEHSDEAIAADPVVESVQVESKQEDAAAAEPPLEEKAAYAVASAGTGAAPKTTLPAEYPAQDSAHQVSASLPASDPGVENRNNELAAAWATWKQVRDSEVGPQAKAETVESAEVRESSHEETIQTDAEPTEAEASAQAAEDASEVASIVESVLADLKPKLMKEIAQKMGKGKKKKKKSD